jgi:hypothetical protein
VSKDKKKSKKKRTVVVKKGVPKKQNHKGHVRSFTIGGGLPTPRQIRSELKGYRNVLMSREEPPMQKGVMTLMEVAEAYFARTCEIEQEILEAQQEGRIPKTGEYNTLRTQEIRSFKELFKSATELGSRRITFESLRYQKEMRGLESL